MTHDPDRSGDGREPGQALAACRPAESAEADLPLGGPCSCLPLAVDDWPACATCGLPQAPGKAFCSFCGRRWVSEGAEAAGPEPSAR